eukprot:2365089-Rhodomonas_salina.1
MLQVLHLQLPRMLLRTQVELQHELFIRRLILRLFECLEKIGEILEAFLVRLFCDGKGVEKVGMHPH